MAKKKDKKKEYVMSKYEQYLIAQHEQRMYLEDQQVKGFVMNVVLPRMRQSYKADIDLQKGRVTWDTPKGLLFYEEMEPEKEEKKK
jgi:hypothetical protein